MQNFSKTENSIHEIILNSDLNFEELQEQNFEMISSYSPKTLPLKLKPDEIKRGFEYQKAMLTFSWLQFKKATGTPWEYRMKKMYEESLEDYDEFMNKYRTELK